MRRLGRGLWLILAFLAIAMGTIGIVLPIVLQMALPAQLWYLRRALPGAACLAIAIMDAGLFARAQRLGEKRTLDGVRTVEDVQALGWQRFEALLAEAFRREGYTVRRKDGSGPDGGVDLRLTRDRQTTLVQCKHWKARAGAPIVRELLGVHELGEESAPMVLILGADTMHDTPAWSRTLCGVDAVARFVVPAMMPDLEAKLASELRPDALVIAGRFPLATWEPVDHVTHERKSSGYNVNQLWVYQRVVVNE